MITSSEEMDVKSLWKRKGL